MPRLGAQRACVKLLIDPFFSSLIYVLPTPLLELIRGAPRVHRRESGKSALGLCGIWPRAAVLSRIDRV